MTVKNVDATNFAVNGVSHLKSDYFAQVVEGKSLLVTKVSDGSVLVPVTPYSQIKDGATGNYLTTLAAFNTFVGTVFGLEVSPSNPVAATTATAGIVKKAAASANTATAPGVAYVQAEAQAVLTELRDLKTKLQTAGVLS